MTKKNLIVTFKVTALVSPEEYEKLMGYPAGSPENEMPPDEPWDKEHPPATQKEMKIKTWIISEEPVELKESFCDAITYSFIKSSELNEVSGDYNTEVLITVDQEKAKKWHDEYFEDHAPEDVEEWNGNLFESCYWGSPECAIVEDDIAPGGYRDDIDIEYL